MQNHIHVIGIDVSKKTLDICVTFNEKIRKKRLGDFRGYTSEEIMARIQSQPPEKAYREAADYILENNGEETDLIAQIEKQIERVEKIKDQKKKKK